MDVVTLPVKLSAAQAVTPPGSAGVTDLCTWAGVAFPNYRFQFLCQAVCDHPVMKLCSLVAMSDTLRSAASFNTPLCDVGGNLRFWDKVFPVSRLAQMLIYSCDPSPTYKGFDRTIPAFTTHVVGKLPDIVAQLPGNVTFVLNESLHYLSDDDIMLMAMSTTNKTFAAASMSCNLTFYSESSEGADLVDGDYVTKWVGNDVYKHRVCAWVLRGGLQFPSFTVRAHVRAFYPRDAPICLSVILERRDDCPVPIPLLPRTRGLFDAMVVDWYPGSIRNGVTPVNQLIIPRKNNAPPRCGSGLWCSRPRRRKTVYLSTRVLSAMKSQLITDAKDMELRLKRYVKEHAPTINNTVIDDEMLADSMAAMLEESLRYQDFLRDPLEYDWWFIIAVFVALVSFGALPFVAGHCAYGGTLLCIFLCALVEEIIRPMGLDIGMYEMLERGNFANFLCHRYLFPFPRNVFVSAVIHTLYNVIAIRYHSFHPAKYFWLPTYFPSYASLYLECVGPVLTLVWLGLQLRRPKVLLLYAANFTAQAAITVFDAKLMTASVSFSFIAYVVCVVAVLNWMHPKVGRVAFIAACVTTLFWVFRLRLIPVIALATLVYFFVRKRPLPRSSVTELVSGSARVCGVMPDSIPAIELMRTRSTKDLQPFAQLGSRESRMDKVASPLFVYGHSLGPIECFVANTNSELQAYNSLRERTLRARVGQGSLIIDQRLQDFLSNLVFDLGLQKDVEPMPFNTWMASESFSPAMKKRFLRVLKDMTTKFQKKTFLKREAIPLTGTYAHPDALFDLEEKAPRHIQPIWVSRGMSQRMRVSVNCSELLPLVVGAHIDHPDFTPFVIRQSIPELSPDALAVLVGPSYSAGLQSMDSIEGICEVWSNKNTKEMSTRLVQHLAFVSGFMTSSGAEVAPISSTGLPSTTAPEWVGSATYSTESRNRYLEKNLRLDNPEFAHFLLMGAGVRAFTGDVKKKDACDCQVKKNIALKIMLQVFVDKFVPYLYANYSQGYAFLLAQWFFTLFCMQSGAFWTTWKNNVDMMLVCGAAAVWAHAERAINAGRYTYTHCRVWEWEPQHLLSLISTLEELPVRFQVAGDDFSAVYHRSIEGIHQYVVRVAAFYGFAVELDIGDMTSYSIKAYYPIPTTVGLGFALLYHRSGPKLGRSVNSTARDYPREVWKSVCVGILASYSFVPVLSNAAKLWLRELDGVNQLPLEAYSKYDQPQSGHQCQPTRDWIERKYDIPYVHIVRTLKNMKSFFEDNAGTGNLNFTDPVIEHLFTKKQFGIYYETADSDLLGYRQSYIDGALLNVFGEEKQFPRYLSDLVESLPYSSGLYTGSSNGQLKLILRHRYLRQHFKLDAPSERLVVYVGSGGASSRALNVLLECATQVLCFDPAGHVGHQSYDWFNLGSAGTLLFNSRASMCFDTAFTSTVARELSELKGREIILISDMRTVGSNGVPTDAHVLADQKNLEEWIEILRPVDIAVKFRCPWPKVDSNMTYTWYGGSCLLQPFARPGSTEVVLVARYPYVRVGYDCRDFERRLSAHNLFNRSSRRFENDQAYRPSWDFARALQIVSPGELSRYLQE